MWLGMGPIRGVDLIKPPEDSVGKIAEVVFRPIVGIINRRFRLHLARELKNPLYLLGPQFLNQLDELGLFFGEGHAGPPWISVVSP